MPAQITTLTTTTYLQVPKVLSYRKSRSRSSSKPRTVDVAAVQSAKDRLPSPVPAPSIMAAMQRKSSSYNGNYGNGFHQYTSNGSHHQSASNGDASTTITITNGDLNGDYYTLAPSPSPPPQLPLRHRLIGAYRLESYVAYPTPSCKIQRPTYPMTKSVTGLIMYTPDGYMSAHMLIPGQMSFNRGEGDEAQWAEAGKRCFCYAGPYYISNEGDGRREVLRHTFQVCNLPGWVGDIQVRTWDFEEDNTVLVLGSEEPTEIKGEKRMPVLKWRRVRDNANENPPPPMPQIKVSGPGEP